MKKEILGFKAPAKECTDAKCPFHGQIAPKEEMFRGKVIRKDINRSATIEWFRSQYLPKYERYEVRRSRMRVHNPACLNAEVGQEVVALRTRPLSKTKNHVIIQVVVNNDNKKNGNNVSGASNTVNKKAETPKIAKTAAKTQ